MTTHSKSNEKRAWWERIVDSGDSKATGQKLFKSVIVVAIFGCAVYAGITFFKKSQTGARAEISELITRAQLLLPVNSFEMRGRVREADGYFRSKSSEFNGRIMRSGAFTDEKGAAEYVTKLEKMIDELKASQDKAAKSPDAWLYWNTIQQMHGFAALNATDAAKRKEHYQAQLSVISQMEKDYGSHPVLASVVDQKTGVTALGRWRQVAEEELKSVEYLTAAPKADANLSATFELDNGSKFSLKFYSSVAPKTVETFLMLAQRGFYDGTSFHAVDSGEGTLTGGSALSRLIPDRPRAWHKSTVGYNIPGEANPRLSIKKGSVTMERVGAASHGSHFVIHTMDAETPNAMDTVFAEVTEGLDALVKFIGEAKVVTDEQPENTHLPEKSIKIVKVTVTGQQENRSDDSWKAVLVEPKAPDELPEERRLKAKAESRPANESQPATDTKPTK